MLSSWGEVLFLYALPSVSPVSVKAVVFWIRQQKLQDTDSSQA